MDINPLNPIDAAALKPPAPRRPCRHRNILVSDPGIGIIFLGF